MSERGGGRRRGQISGVKIGKERRRVVKGKSISRSSDSSNSGDGDQKACCTKPGSWAVVKTALITCKRFVVCCGLSSLWTECGNFDSTLTMMSRSYIRIM
ncbi:hypothetical protein RRG08_021187 [Elysia crispata]|uniref:Uncharacterized protein n=1 Tax=Elysia crispata TaxID=231223 RepID=A0AAE0YNZ0_9GAST|nr:hypothetical protein RRG08_021187 [Elysia crispata]